MNRFISIASAFLGGAVLGAFLHYTLYRISLPLEPFIYFSF